MDIDVLGVAREQAFERDIVNHCRARPIALAIGGAIMFIGIVILVVRHLLAWSLLRRDWGHEARVLVTVAALFASAWFTDQIGLYAVFGAFVVVGTVAAVIFGLVAVISVIAFLAFWLA